MTRADPRARLCRSCGQHFLGDDVPARCPVCEAPATAFREEYPVWFLEPADRPTILADLEASAQLFADAAHDRGDDVLGRAPAPGEWPARQTMEHLLFAEELFATRIGRLLDEDRPDLASRAVWAETPASDEGTAPTGQPASELARRWLALRSAAIDRLTALPEASWERDGRHPEWGRVTVLSQAGYFARHTASHMAQLAVCRRWATAGRALRRVRARRCVRCGGRGGSGDARDLVVWVAEGVLWTSNAGRFGKWHRPARCPPGSDRRHRPRRDRTAGTRWSSIVSE